jgi:hypothetical protein
MDLHGWERIGKGRAWLLLGVPPSEALRRGPTMTFQRTFRHPMITVPVALLIAAVASSVAATLES